MSLAVCFDTRTPPRGRCEHYVILCFCFYALKPVILMPEFEVIKASQDNSC